MDTPEPSEPKKGKFWKTIDELLGLDVIKYNVPEHANTLPYMLGGITLIGILIQALTGTILAQFYNPTPEGAHASVQAIMTTVPMGSLARSIHFWTAQAVVVSIALHVVRVVVTGSYKRPRTFNYIVGVVLISLVLGFLTTGSVLKWDQEASEALDHFTSIATTLGPLGAPLSPAFSSQVSVLSRLYALHVSVLPMIGIAAVGAHFFYIKYFGISPLPRRKKGGEDEPGKQQPFMNHIKGLLKYGSVLFVILLALAVAFPAPLGVQPISGIEVTKPPWPFLGLYAVESLFGVQWLFFASLLPFLGLLAIPFVDRSESQDPRDRKIIVTAFLIALVAILVLILYGALSAPKSHFGG